MNFYSGMCPPVPGDQAGICIEACSEDNDPDDCTGNEKCCFNGCGHVCMSAITGKIIGYFWFDTRNYV